MLVHFDAFAAHAGLIYDVTDPGCQAHTHTHTCTCSHAHAHTHTHTHTLTLATPTGLFL